MKKFSKYTNQNGWTHEINQVEDFGHRKNALRETKWEKKMPGGRREEGGWDKGMGNGVVEVVNERGEGNYGEIRIQNSYIDWFIYWLINSAIWKECPEAWLRLEPWAFLAL